MAPGERTRRAGLLPVAFFQRPAEVVAAELLGCTLVSTLGGVRVAARIVETEAYLGVDDPASHAWRGRRTAANASIYAAPGTWYVYRSYGMHWCLNLVSAPVGQGAAVLLRALEPLEGLEAMAARRGRPLRELCAGPGRLAEALGATRALDGLAMRASAVTVLAPRGHVPPPHVTGPRIGITRAADWPLRFCVAGSRFLSRPVTRNGPASPPGRRATHSRRAQ